jgi:hypothetical protein
MFNRNQTNVSESSIVDRSGSALLDEIDASISADRVLGINASPGGLAKAMRHGPRGFEVDAIGPYTPGIDDISTIDINETLGSGEQRARKVLSTGSPNTIHVVMDVPERTALLEGKLTYEYLGNFVLGVAKRVATVMGDTELAVYHTNAPRSVLFQGDPHDAEQVFRDLRRVKGTTESKTLDELINTAARNTDEDNDATVIISDFMDGYDSATNTFSWETALKRHATRQEDLLRINRINSVSHSRIPYGVSDGLDAVTVDAINRDYSLQAQLKNERIEAVFKNLLAKSVKISTDDTKSPRSIVKLLLGDEIE